MSLSILIADSNEIIRRGIRTLLEGRREWQICGEAQTGGEAIEKVKTLNPDVLLLDVMLPDMDPVEAISGVKAICSTVKIVALAMPASGVPAARAMAAGASGLAMKSDAANDFLLTVHNVGQSQAYLSLAAIQLLQDQLTKTEMPDTGPADVTIRELQVLRLLANGRTNKEVGQALDISVRTVDVHRTNIMRKLKLATYSELVQFAVRHKLISG